MASFPGSGNTWLRYLLQQSTGIFTGTVYTEKNVHGFVDLPVFDNSVLATKTHMHPSEIFDKAVLIIRDPFDALVANWNGIFGGILGHAPNGSFQNSGEEKWKRYIYKGIQLWRDFNTAWYHKFDRNGTLHLISYEKMVKNTELEVSKVLAFLNITPLKRHLKCCMSRKEGFALRKKLVKNQMLFDASMNKTINDIKYLVHKDLGL